MPESLDETYARILGGIKEAQKDKTHRLLQCLTVAVRPLRVEELAEILTFDFQASGEQGIPKLKEDWQWDDLARAVLSTRYSFITVVHTGDSRVVQLSHYSVKEFLTSNRLVKSHGDLSRFHVGLEPAHTIMSQACLGTLLRLYEHSGNNGAEDFPQALVGYAAQHWVCHAQFEKVPSRIRDGMYDSDTFDSSIPHFAAWRRAYDIDIDRPGFTCWLRRLNETGSPLSFAPSSGLNNLAEDPTTVHLGQEDAGSGRISAPHPANLYEDHVCVANLLHKHGMVVDVQDRFTRTPLHKASIYGRVDVMRWLLDHAADVNARKGDRWTPLHLAAHNMHPDAVQALLEHGADVNSQNDEDKTPLYEALFYPDTSLEEKVVVDIVQRLLEHGANPNIRDRSQSTPLHRASSKGWVEVVRLLLSYGANAEEEDEEGRTPIQVASSKGHHETTNLLLEHGAVPQPA